MKQCKYKQAIPLLVLSLVVLVSGCASILPGNEAFVVRAEQTQQYAYDTFDAFIKAERSYEILQTDPTEYRKSAVHQFAEKSRKESISWINSLKVVIRTYKSNRNPDNRQAVSEALAILKVALSQAEVYVAQIKTTQAVKGTN